MRSEETIAVQHPRRGAQTVLAALAFAAALGIALFAAGCGDDDDGPTAPGNGAPQDTFPPATTPEGAAERWFDTYEAQDTLAFHHSMTRDFRYVFSSQSDPDLVIQYGSNWGVALEMAAAHHLFSGFTDDHGSAQPAATSIQVVLPPLIAQNDPAHSDSTNHYSIVAIPNLTLRIDLANDASFDVSAPFNVFVVRGDAAVLGSGQTTDSTTWYVRRVDDLSPPLAGSPGVRGPVFNPAAASTWGRVRSQYAERRVVVHQ